MRFSLPPLLGLARPAAGELMIAALRALGAASEDMSSHSANSSLCANAGTRGPSPLMAFSVRSVSSGSKPAHASHISRLP